jgi:Mrp family chromosome partitioning ATPase
LRGAVDDEGDRKFAVLPIGKSSTLVTPGDLMASHNTDFQIATLKSKFRMVIFDLPAISESPDALAVAHRLDGIVLVVNAKTVSVDELSACANALNQGDDLVLGVVINKWDGRLDA